MSVADAERNVASPSRAAGYLADLPVQGNVNQRRICRARDSAKQGSKRHAQAGDRIVEQRVDFVRRRDCPDEAVCPCSAARAVYGPRAFGASVCPWTWRPWTDAWILARSTCDAVRWCSCSFSRRAISGGPAPQDRRPLRISPRRSPFIVSARSHAVPSISSCTRMTMPIGEVDGAAHTVQRFLQLFVVLRINVPAMGFVEEYCVFDQSRALCRRPCPSVVALSIRRWSMMSPSLTPGSASVRPVLIPGYDIVVFRFGLFHCAEILPWRSISAESNFLN